MPEFFGDFTNRLDHLLSAVLPGRVERLNITDHLKVNVKIPTDDDSVMNMSINGVRFILPFSYYLDAKYNSYEQMMNNYGFTSTCSIIGRYGNSFFNSHFELTSEYSKKYTYLNKYNLMAADCTDSPKLGVFIQYNNDDDDLIDGILICTGGICIKIDTNENPIQIELDGQKINIQNEVFQYPQNELFYDFK